MRNAFMPNSDEVRVRQGSCNRFEQTILKSEWKTCKQMAVSLSLTLFNAYRKSGTGTGNGTELSAKNRR